MNRPMLEDEWTYAAHHAVQSLLVDGDDCFVASHNTRLASLNTADGKERWRVRIKNPWGWMAATKTHVFYLNQHSLLIAVDRANGQVLWSLGLRGIWRWLHAFGDRVIVGGWRGYTGALVRQATPAGLSFEALGFVLPLLSKDAASQAELAAVRRRIANGVTESASAAHFAVSYGDGAHLLLHSDRRADAILLEALIADQPASDLVAKLVEGLLAHRTAGRWTSTQENVFVLLALERYFQAYEKTTPDFVARAWLGERYAGSHAFRGRTSERHHIGIPMAALQETVGTSDLLLAKEGAGRLYYRIGLRYAPQDLRLAPLDRGFTVERTYEGVDSTADVKRDADGTWRIRAGASVRVRLTMVAPARRHRNPLTIGKIEAYWGHLTGREA